jgi:FAD binding domain
MHQRIPLIPQGVGTSLAGQCVGRGLVVDLTRHMDQSLEIDQWFFRGDLNDPGGCLFSTYPAIMRPLIRLPVP